LKALLCETLGGAGALKIAEIAAPAPGKEEVAVRVAFAALNFFDTLIIQGKYQFKPALPFSPAGEFGGRIHALGEGVDGVAVGEPVLGYSGHSAAREIVVCPAKRVIASPSSLPLETAACLPIAYGTTLHALTQRGELKSGETLVVLGASGGVGLAAVEIGALLGARVIACASSDEKLALAKRCGAQEGVNYATQDLRSELKRLSGGRGVDVVYDPVGGTLTEPALRSLAWKGRLLVIGFASGEIPKLPMNLALLKGCDIRGVFWTEFVNREPDLYRADMRRLIAWAAAGRIARHRPTIYPLENFQDAFAAIAERRALGKVLLKVA